MIAGGSIDTGYISANLGDNNGGNVVLVSIGGNISVDPDAVSGIQTEVAVPNGVAG